MVYTWNANVFNVQMNVACIESRDYLPLLVSNLTIIIKIVLPCLVQANKQRITQEQ
uniref:Uncharacterized protein n=1 Tax=Octopus bimaculoides TaxID=37653 RepID=A0A0L8FXI5_OCTBM